MPSRKQESVLAVETRRTGEAQPLRTLVQAASALLGSASVDEIVPKLLELARLTLRADAYALWEHDLATDEWQIAAYAGLSDEYAETAMRAISGVRTEVSLDEPLIAEDIATTEWLKPAHRDAHFLEGNKSLLAAGLVHQGKVLGTLTFYYRRHHEFTEAERSAASTLANLAAAAVATTRLYEEQAKTSEERRFLAEASAILASSLDYETTLKNVASLSVPQFADWCAVDVVRDAGTVERLTIAHADPEQVRRADALARRFPWPGPNAGHGVAKVLRTLEPELVRDISEEFLAEATRETPELFEILRPLDLKSSMCAPLVTRGRALGAITFVSSRRHYGSTDLALAEDIARRAAVAVDNALLLRRREQAQRVAEAARERLGVLADASQALASTLDYKRTLTAIGTLVVPRYADWYAVDVADDDGRFRRIALVHGDRSKQRWVERGQLFDPADPDEPEGTSRAVRTGESLLYRELTDEFLRSSARNDAHYEVLRRLGAASAIVVPLTAGGRTFGALILVSADEGRRYDQDDVDFVEHLGRRVAVAVDNARLYREAQDRAHAALVVEHVADGVVLVDHEGVIRLWNPAAARMTELAAEDVVGRKADSVFSSWDSISPLATTGETRAQTLPTEVNGRELWLSITGVEFDGGCVYAFRDLTAERAVDRLKSDFVATVSHELRTPLAAIYGAALTLRRSDVRLGENQRTGLLEVIATESDRLARIVNDILFASRIESGTMQTTIERCDVAELARTVVDAAAQYVPPNVKLTLTVAPGTPAAVADPDKVRQVIANLIDNAVKYSPHGGTVDVAIDQAEDGFVRVCVRDEGLGIPAGEQQRVFEKFYRLDPNLTLGVGGTGLGLYISRELVERMGGRIWVESTPARGSWFVFELPVAP
jgi:two-component system sensor histidine kinase BarA